MVQQNTKPETKIINFREIKQICPHCERETNWTVFRAIETKKSFFGLINSENDKGLYVKCNVCETQYAQDQWNKLEELKENTIKMNRIMKRIKK